MAGHFFGSLAQAGRMAIHVEATGRDAAPHRRGRVQGGRARAQDGAPGRVDRDPFDEGKAVKVARLRLPRREHPLGRDRAAAARRRARRRRRGRRPRRAAGRRLGALGDGRAAAPGTRRGAAHARRRRPARCSASASASSSRSSTPRRTAASTGSGSCPAARCGSPRAACRGWAGPSVDGTGAYYFAHSYAAETPCATAWSEGIVAEARSGSFLGVQFHPEKSGAAGARYLDRVLTEVRERFLSRA